MQRKPTSFVVSFRHINWTQRVREISGGGVGRWGIGCPQLFGICLGEGEAVPGVIRRQRTPRPHRVPCSKSYVKFNLKTIFALNFKINLLYNNNDKAGSRHSGQEIFFLLTPSFRLKAGKHKSFFIIAALGSLASLSRIDFCILSFSPPPLHHEHTHTDHDPS